MNNFRKVPFNLLYNHLTTVTSKYNNRALGVNLNILKRFAHSYEGDGKTSANVINMREDLGLMVLSYSPHGFRLNNKLFIRGPMVLFPNTALSWQVENIDDISEESLCIFPILDPGVDIVVLGVGDKENLTKERRRHITSIMKKFNIPVEILPTDAACTTFNFLVSESRFVGAAFFPQFKGYNLATDSLEKNIDEHGIFS